MALYRTSDPNYFGKDDGMVVIWEDIFQDKFIYTKKELDLDEYRAYFYHVLRQR